MIDINIINFSYFKTRGILCLSRIKGDDINMKNITAFFIGAIGASSMLFSSIHQIDSISEIAPHLQNAGKETLILSPTTSLIDEPVFISAAGLTPYQEVIIHAKASHQETYGTYLCDWHGSLDLAQAKPKDGTYKEIDGMGLLCSMPDRCEGEVVFILESHGKELDRQTILRQSSSIPIQKIDIRQEGLTASLFIPDGQKSFPVIIYLSGSNGGLNEKRAKYLAAHGFATMALAYFAAEGLPPNLEQIPLEFFLKALTYLKTHPRIDAKKIGLYGVSRGAELALLLGIHYPQEIAALAVVVPTSTVYGGLSETPVPAWLWKGEPLPFARCEKSDSEGGPGS